MAKTTNEFEYKADFLSDRDHHDDYIKEFDAYEAMLASQVYDSVSRSVSDSGITDSYAATLAIERSARVLGKLPEGMVEAAAKRDSGKAIFMDILRQKWIYPNANAQHSFKTKLRQWQLYSSVYGYMPMFYDWNIGADGYIGPDCWLWNPRNLIPQQGRTSIKDMDYVTALSWVGKIYLESLLEDEGGDWDTKVVKDLIKKAETETTESDTERDTQLQRTREQSSVKKGILLATRYEAGEGGHWITFAPDHGHAVLRDIENPHKNGKIPFVIKYSQPLFDSFYGMGDFQRAKSIQFARDGLRNFYFKGIKMNLIPPIVANSNGVIKHTIDYREGAVMLETLPNSIRRLETSTAGLSTYQAAQSDLTGSLLSLYGTQNASLPGAEALNPDQGKTPAAIRMFSAKEATRDGQEREFLEGAIEELTDSFFGLVATIGTEDIPVNLFVEDVNEIVEQGHKDILDFIEPNESGDTGILVVKPEAIKGAEYKFNITPGTTLAMSNEEKVQSLVDYMGVIAKFKDNLMQDPTVKINWRAILDSYRALANVKGAENFIENVPVPQEPMPEEQTPLAPAAATMVGGMQYQNPEIAQAAQQVLDA